MLGLVDVRGGGDHLMYATFWSTLWVIPGRMRHPLNQCAKTTGRTLGLPDVRCSVRELVTNFSYKQTVPPPISLTHSHPLVCPYAAKTLSLSFE
jgi:hypothetical protein